MMAIHFDEVWNDEECNEMCDVCRHGNGERFLPKVAFTCTIAW